MCTNLCNQRPFEPSDEPLKLGETYSVFCSNFSLGYQAACMCVSKQISKATSIVQLKMNVTIPSCVAYRSNLRLHTYRVSGRKEDRVKYT